MRVAWIQIKKNAVVYSLFAVGGVAIVLAFLWTMGRRKKQAGKIAFEPADVAQELANRMAIAHAQAAVEVIQARTKDNATVAELKRISSETDTYTRLQSLIALKNRLSQ